MNTLASTKMVIHRLNCLFKSNPPNPQFTEEMADKMLATIRSDLLEGRKEEYQSAVGLAVLFARSGGKPTEHMNEVVANAETHNLRHQNIINEVKATWDHWDSTEDVNGRGDNCLDFESFYNGFMAHYFSCFTCADARKALRAIDMDKDGTVDWDEFLMYVKYVLAEYPNTPTAEDTIKNALVYGIIPAMRYVKLEANEINSA